jgi:hypothetical protein
MASGRGRLGRVDDDSDAMDETRCDNINCMFHFNRIGRKLRATAATLRAR